MSQFRYIMSLNHTFSIYYGTQSDITFKSYYRLNLPQPFLLNFELLDILWTSIEYPSKSYGCLMLPQASLPNLEHFDILWASIRHSNQNLRAFEVALGFFAQFQYIIDLNRTSQSKDIDV